MSLHRRVSIPGIALGLVAALTVSLVGQGVSPLTGTWKANLAKSKYNPSNVAPKSGTTRFEVTQDSIKTVTDGVDAQGRTTHGEYAARFDGKDYPWKGTIDGRPNPDQDAVAWKKIDNNNYEVTNKLKGQALTTLRIVIAPDGKSRTNTVTGKNAQGQTVSNTVVYDKQ